MRKTIMVIGLEIFSNCRSFCTMISTVRLAISTSIAIRNTLNCYLLLRGRYHRLLLCVTIRYRINGMRIFDYCSLFIVLVRSFLVKITYSHIGKKEPLISMKVIFLVVPLLTVLNDFDMCKVSSFYALNHTSVKAFDL